MVNPTGINTWGEKSYPPDDELRDYLLGLAKLSLTVPEKLVRLNLDLGLQIRRSTFFELQKRLEIPTIRRPGISAEDIRTAVTAEIRDDTHQGRGPLVVKDILQDKLILVGCDKIRALMKEHVPEGFHHRRPGGPRRVIMRQPLTSVGPFREICADGHEKFNSQALRMGNLSIPIYGYKDKWSGMILKMCAVPDSRRAAAVGHIYLDLIDQWEGIPIQLTTDKGSEIGWQTNIQSILREFYAPNVDMDVFPPSVSLKSTQNTVIESCWKWLRSKFGFNVKEIILTGKLEHRFHPHVQGHHDLFYWIFVPLIQEQLDTYVTWWNNHKIRKQKDKLMPSAHIPIDALRHPSLFNARSWLIKVPAEARAEMRNVLSDAVGPREAYLSWYSPEFDIEASEAYEALGKPPLLLHSAWEVFTAMANVMGI